MTDMIQKQIKYYDTLADFFRHDYLTHPAALKNMLSFMLGYSYETAEELWEYLIIKNNMAERRAAAILGNTAFGLFLEKNRQRALKTLFDKQIFLTAFFSQNPEASGAACDLIFDLLAANKLAQAETALNYLAKNPVSDYPKNLQKIIAALIKRIISKADGAGAVALHKKQHALLKTFVAKLKGADKALLEQKLNELAPTDIYGD